MKQICLFAMMFVYICCNGQIQQGYVKTAGKKGQPGVPLNGVLLKTNYSKSSPVVSNSNGTFSFPVNGNKFQMSKIQKNNYRLSDEDVIGRDYSYTPSLPVTFSMISLDEYRQFQKEIETPALAKKDQELNMRLRQLDEDLERKRIENIEYARRVEELEDERSSFQRMISRLSDLYARTDYDDIDSLDLLINQYIEEGEYDLAATLVDSKGDIRERIKDTNARERNAELLRSIAEKETQSVEYQKQSIIKDLGIKIQIAQSKLQQDSVQYWIEFRADYDSLNVEYQIEALNNLRSLEFRLSQTDNNAYWNHIDKNRRYVLRAMKYLSTIGKEYSAEALNCLELLNWTYQTEYLGVSSATGASERLEDPLTAHKDSFVIIEAMNIAVKMMEVEQRLGMPAIGGLSAFYENLSYIDNSSLYKSYYLKSKEEKYEDSALQLYKNVDVIDRLLPLYNCMSRCATDNKKQKRINKLRLDLYLLRNKIDGFLHSDVAQIYWQIGEQKKAIQYQIRLVSDLEKRSVLDDNIISRINLKKEYENLEIYLEKSKDYKSMCECTWKLYDLYRKEEEHFSTYNTRFECAKYLQKYVRACVFSGQTKDTEKYIIESLKLAEDAYNLRRDEYLNFVCKNYIYLSQVYAARQDYEQALTTIAKAKQMRPDNEDAEEIELFINKKAMK